MSLTGRRDVHRRNYHPLSQLRSEASPDEATAPDLLEGDPAYMTWHGSARFYCGGRIYIGPDVRNLLVTVSLIVVPCTLFFAFV